jgi:type II secretory pathway pseudopilin PulG
MNIPCKALAPLVLILAVATSSAQSTDSSSSTKKVHHHAEAREHKPSVESQIEELRGEMQSQKGEIDSLKQQLSDRDAQLQQAQQAAASAQQAAQAAQAAANQTQQQVSETSTSVSSLQTSVNDLKSSDSALATSVQQQTTEIKKEVEHPDALYFKGITLSPTGSFLAAETVWRQGATGSDINTPPTSIPLANSDDAQISEFFGSGRQSRAALKATGQLSDVTLTGYYEADWLGAGVTSNNNQSNSYVMRQRQLWADARFNNGWDVSGGQGWSLATETTQGETRGSEILPATIDPQYEAGFVWTRQYSFRVTKDFGNKFWLGASAENAQTLNPAGSGLPLNVLLGSAGTGGGLYNETTNYSFNYTPDFVVKAVLEPGWGHWELFGIERNFRDRIYPGETCSNTTVTSGITTTSCTGTTAGAYNDAELGGGIGGGLRVPLAAKKVTVGLKGLYGRGVGRYGDSTIADITIEPDGIIQPLRAFSALGTLEINPTSRELMYFNYGGDYVYRDYFGKNGYGSPLTNMSGCDTEPPPGGTNNTYGGGGTGFDPSTPSNCGNQNKDTQEFTVGNWYYFYRGPKGGMRFGLQYSRWERDLWSGAGGTTNPGGGANGIDNMFWTSFRYYLP